MLAKIRRMHIRERLSVREIVCRTGLSGNTIRNRLRQADVVEPKSPKCETISVSSIHGRNDCAPGLSPTATAPSASDAHRAGDVPSHQEHGYAGRYARVCAFVRRWKAEGANAPKKTAHVPLTA